MKKILISGGTGLVGSRLSNLLAHKGYQVSHLSRTEDLQATYPAYGWDLQNQTMNPDALEEVDAIINLAGAGIADKRWTTERKRIIEESRTLSAPLIKKYLEQLNHRPRVFVACSAVGFYGDRGAEELTESSAMGTGFMSKICQKWEQSSDCIAELGIRRPVIRVGVVLSTKGGAMQELMKSYRFRVGSYFGNGQMYMSWVHLDDICRLFIAAVEDQNMTATYNGCAPQPATSKELAYAMSDALGRSSLIVPVPTFALKLLLGEMSAVVLNSTKAIPKALENTAFSFEHTDLTASIKDIIQKGL